MRCSSNRSWDARIFRRRASSDLADTLFAAHAPALSSPAARPEGVAFRHRRRPTAIRLSECDPLGS